MAYVVLLFIVLFIFSLGYILKLKFTSPTMITCIVYMLCILFAMIGLSSWNSVRVLNSKIYLIFFLGLLSFMIGEIIVLILHKNKAEDNSRYNINQIVIVKKWKFIVCIAILFIAILFTIRDLKRICGLYGFSSNNIVSLISFYRNKSELFNSGSTAAGATFSSLTSHLIKASNMVCIIFIFIFINNIFYKLKFKKNSINLLPLLLCIFLSYLQSGRGTIIKFFTAALIIYIILLEKNKRIYNNKININKKFVKIALKLVVIIAPLFYLVMPLFGREASANFIEYISFYIGTSIPSFNIFLNNYVPGKSIYFGSETLYSVYRFLNNLGITNYTSAISLEFIDFNGLQSNVYTAFRRYYSDFSFSGLIICEFIFAVVFSKLYYSAIHKNNVKYTLFYAYFFSYLIDQFRDELFFTSFINTTTIAYILILNVLVWFVFDNFRKKGESNVNQCNNSSL